MAESIECDLDAFKCGELILLYSFFLNWGSLNQTNIIVLCSIKLTVFLFQCVNIEIDWMGKSNLINQRD